MKNELESLLQLPTKECESKLEDFVQKYWNLGLINTSCRAIEQVNYFE